MKKITLLYLCFLCFTGYTQSLILIDTTKQDFRKNIVETYQKSVVQQKIFFNQNIKNRKIQKEVETSYKEINDHFIDQVNKGFFVDSPEYTELFNRLLNQISEANPEFSEIKNTQIILSFGDKANAYTIGNNIVVILVPLIKNLKNEYQLAFILCHEIAHNLLSHTYNDLIEYAELVHSKEIKIQTKKIEKEKYKKAEIASELYKKIIYGKRKNNRKLEFQADSLGLILYKKAYYDFENESVITLKNLSNLDKPLDSLMYKDYEYFFGTEKFPIQQNEFIKNEIVGYNYDESIKFWEIDSLKTHPDAYERAMFIQKKLTNTTTKEIDVTKEFLVLKKSSSYNFILGLYAIENYGQSLYESLLLLKEYPKDPYLLNLTYQNLIQLQKAQQAYNLNKYLETSNPKFSKSYNTFLNFFRQLRKAQLQEIINKYTF